MERDADFACTMIEGLALISVIDSNDVLSSLPPAERLASRHALKIVAETEWSLPVS